MNYIYLKFSEVSWKEFEEVYNWIAETKGYQPYVIDADELQKDPGERH